MNATRARRMEFGDFQTPVPLAREICDRLASLGVQPDVILEPTCGVGAFVSAASMAFPNAREILGFEINSDYLERLNAQLDEVSSPGRILLEQADFFHLNWRERLARHPGRLLVIGNFPWVTNAALGGMGGSNLPEKSNFQGHDGFDAISGKANFDISEWMLLEVMKWFDHRSGDVAMLVKTPVARKILAHAARQEKALQESFMVRIDARKYFGAAVDACLLVMRFSSDKRLRNYDYIVYPALNDERGRRIGHRRGLIVGDMETFEKFSFLVGKSPQKWRSGIKHDASAIMELTRTERGLMNGLGEAVRLEETFLFPLFKGSDVAHEKGWRGKFMLVPQRFVGESTSFIREVAPLTWGYLMQHAETLDARKSAIYAKNPRFSIFGVGDYTFRPWKIAVCGLYKSLGFRLIGSEEGKPVVFDDTVSFISFDDEEEARETHRILCSEPCTRLLSALIFWDEKRPIKAGTLNLLDWSQARSPRWRSDQARFSSFERQATLPGVDP